MLKCGGNRSGKSKRRRKRSNSFDRKRLNVNFWSGRYEPINKKEMAAWYDYALTQTGIDVFITLNVFSGRFDQREMLSNVNEDLNYFVQKKKNFKEKLLY